MNIFEKWFFSENVPRFSIEIAQISVEQGRDRLFREEFQSQVMRFAGKNLDCTFSWKMKLLISAEMLNNSACFFL